MMRQLIESTVDRVVKNRWGFDEKGLSMAKKLGFFDALSYSAVRRWIKAEPICSNHCSAMHCQGKALYFNPMGMLVAHRSGPYICPHAVAQISPLIYMYYDALLTGRNPNHMIFSHVTCTDPGLAKGGLGDNLFRITHEKMPWIETFRLAASMIPWFFRKNRKAKSQISTDSGNDTFDCFPEKSEPFIDLNTAHRFFSSSRRKKRLAAANRYSDRQIVIRVVEADGCMAGHLSGDEFILDSFARVLPKMDSSGICILALAKVYYRVLLILERMAQNNQEMFSGALISLPISCYGAGMPYGACGQIHMTVSVEKNNDQEANKT